MARLGLLVLQRLAAAVGILVALVAILFLLQQVSNVNPVHAMLGPGASQRAIAAETRRLGLNRPVWYQFIRYLGHLAEGNFGVSYSTRGSVGHLLALGFPATFELAVFSLLLALVMAVILGVTSALNLRGAAIVRIIMLIGGSTPTFLVAIFGLLVLYKDLGLLPVSGQMSGGLGSQGGAVAIDSLVHGNLSQFVNALWHLLLPSFCVALGPAVSIGRMLRSSLASALGSDWARTARSKGLRERTVLLRHALRNSLGPALTMVGLQLAVMLAGVVIVEEIFSWPGIGFLMAQSIPTSDLPVIIGVTLVLGVSYVVINLLVDVLQVVVDPRQRL